jgi:hypothetical protein
LFDRACFKQADRFSHSLAVFLGAAVHSSDQCQHFLPENRLHADDLALLQARLFQLKLYL